MNAFLHAAEDSEVVTSLFLRELSYTENPWGIKVTQMHTVLC